MRNVFVFGSNLAGRHGKGDALYTKQHHGAIYGQGYGLQGTSFAIPTKDTRLISLPLRVIDCYVELFITFAINNPELTFELTPIGCGLAGFKPEDIAPLFKDAPSNVILPMEFKEILNG